MNRIAIFGIDPGSAFSLFFWSWAYFWFWFWFPLFLGPLLPGVCFVTPFANRLGSLCFKLCTVASLQNNSGIKVLLRCYKQWHKVLLQACCGENVTLTPNPSIEMPEKSTMCTQHLHAPRLRVQIQHIEPGIGRPGSVP